MRWIKGVPVEGSLSNSMVLQGGLQIVLGVSVFAASLTRRSRLLASAWARAWERLAASSRIKGSITRQPVGGDQPGEQDAEQGKDQDEAVPGAGAIRWLG